MKEWCATQTGKVHDFLAGIATNEQELTDAMGHYEAGRPNTLPWSAQRGSPELTARSLHGAMAGSLRALH